jgi:hypothetical protein
MLCSYFNLIHCMHICLITHTIFVYARLLIINTGNLICVVSIQVIMDEYSCVYRNCVGPSSVQNVINHSIAVHQHPFQFKTPTNKTFITKNFQIIPADITKEQNIITPTASACTVMVSCDPDCVLFPAKKIRLTSTLKTHS